MPPTRQLQSRRLGYCGLALTRFGGHHGTAFHDTTRAYQEIRTQLTTFQQQFVQLLNDGTSFYLQTDVANPKLQLLNTLNTPTEAIFERPPDGNDASLPRLHFVIDMTSTSALASLFGHRQHQTWAVTTS
ncbi:hypothetical protein MUBE_03275 [Mycobacterium uberis]|uniref:PE domain-containing protein n=1 Tax=Mycobacterium uberis TaxID=2162698 RepID=A0A3E1HKC9_9MYCO|nr:hypothetical protein MUBE_03275 [Mycobacterium uberis]